MNKFDIQRLYDEAEQMIEIPNKLLTVDLEDNRLGGRSCRRIHELLDQADPAIKKTQYQKDKAEKAKRIEKYREQYENSVAANGQEMTEFELEYDVDEYRQYKFLQAWAKACPAIDITEDDLIDGV